jgi:hypothetical protein
MTSDSKLYIFNSPPKVELDALSYFGPCDWGGYVWDRKRWEPQVEQELRISAYGEWRRDGKDT